MRLLAAFQFLTAIPLPLRRRATEEEIGRSQGYFPLVGLFLGGVLLGLDRLLGLGLPSAMVNVLLIIILVLLTGALHLDGFVDTCDGIAGQRTPEERWRVIRDSRAGGFGVVGAGCLLLLKYVSLASIPETSRTAALLLMPVVGRWAMTYAIFVYPYARPDGLGRMFKQQANWRSFILATVITLAVAGGFSGLVGVVVMVAIWVWVMVAAVYLRRKFAGLTGDSYGAINETSEVLVLILICLITRNSWLMIGFPW